MAKKKIKEVFVRNPWPVFFNGTITTAEDTETCEHQNNLNEVSEIKAWRVRAPPSTTVDFKYTEKGSEVTVFAGVKVGRFPLDAAGFHVIKFREVERDQPFIVRKHQYARLLLDNKESFTISYDVILDRNKVTFFEPIEVQEASVTKAGGKK